MPKEKSRDDFEIDLLGEKVQVTGKRMPNGEVRRRFRFQNGTKLSHTVAPEASAWQEAHYHVGLIEIQVVLSGKMAVAVRNEDGSYKVYLYSPGEVSISRPLEDHNVYLYPGSEIATLTCGTPVPNDEKGEDWYRGSEVFNQQTKMLEEHDFEAMAEMQARTVNYPPRRSL